MKKLNVPSTIKLTTLAKIMFLLVACGASFYTGMNAQKQIQAHINSEAVSLVSRLK